MTSLYICAQNRMVEGIRALYINGAPVLHIDVWFSYEYDDDDDGGGGGGGGRRRRFFFNFKTIYI